jgi:peroxiredoxin
MLILILHHNPHPTQKNRTNLKHRTKHPKKKTNTNQIIYASDLNAEWSNKLGLAIDLSKVGFGVRTKRYALIIDNLKVTFIGVRTFISSHLSPTMHLIN